jgi:Uma2 family endonuclease
MVAKTAPTQQTQTNQVEIRRWMVTVANYHKMHEIGILGEDDRVELIDGEVRVMSPIGSLHAAIVNRLVALLTSQIGQTAIVSVQNPIQLSTTSEPQPDLAILKYRPDFYAQATPSAADVLLYALAGIPEVWITDVEGKAVERYTDPQGNQYATKQTFKQGQSISINALSTISLNIDSIFGQG